MADKGNKKESKFSGKNIVATVVLIIVAVILLMALFEHAIFEGMVEMIKSFISNIAQTIGHYGLVNSIKMFFKIPIDPIPNMEVYRIGDEQIEMLKQELYSQAVKNDHAGLSEVLLRKILIANCVSTSLDNTLCIAPVTEEEIISDINRRFDEEYEDDELDDALDECKEENSKDVWPAEHADNPKYDLYYVSKVFFYFKDKDKKFDPDYDGWYIGAMGATTIESENDDIEFKNADADFFYRQGPEQFKLAIDSGKKIEEARKILTSIYYKVDDNTIAVYNVKSSQKEYGYFLENDDNDIEYDPDDGEDEDVFYDPQVVNIRIDENIDTSGYALPIELLVDMLNVSQSDEFLENFIDYALEKIKVKIRAYPVIEETTTYDLTTYDIDNNFVLEAYNFSFDAGTDNFKAYRPIVFGREDKDGNSFSGSVVKLSNFDDIDYDGMEYGPTKADGSRDKYNVQKLKSYLKLAFDPGSKYDKSSINECYEKVTTYQTETKWELAPSTVYTWYGSFKYPKPDVKTDFSNSLGLSEEEYNNLIGNTISGSKYNDEYNYMKAEGKFDDKGIEEITRVYILEKLNNQSSVDGTAGVDVHIVTKDNIADKGLDTKMGVENKSHFWNQVINGLIEVAKNDDGKYDSDSNLDYLYSNFKKENKKVYEALTKTKREYLDSTNVRATVENPDDAFKAFLSMLKNTDGVIPVEPGVDQQFDQDGKVVMYDGINYLKVPVGDLLLDNGALELFEYLEQSENTQYLADIFRYLAQLYTGRDFGITESELQLLLTDPTIIPVPGAGGYGQGTGYWWPIGSNSSTETSTGYANASEAPALGKEHVSRAGDTRLRSPWYVTIPGKTPNQDSYYGHPHHWSNKNTTEGAAVDIHSDKQVGKYNIVAITDGIVVEAADDVPNGANGNSGMGNYVLMRTDDGFKVYYLHMHPGTVKVKSGDPIKQGQVLGKVGHTGNSTGAHLHIDIRLNGTIQDTTKFIDPANPRPTAPVGGGGGLTGSGRISGQLLTMLEGMEAVDHYSNGVYTVFNNGVDDCLELSRGVTVGTRSGGTEKWAQQILGRSVKIGDKVTEAEYTQLFEYVSSYSINVVDRALAKNNVKATQNQWDALFLLSYNIPSKVDKAVRLYSQGGNKAYWNYIKQIIHSNGKVAEGLKWRRAEEMELFETGDYNPGDSALGQKKYDAYCKKYQ